MEVEGAVPVDTRFTGGRPAVRRPWRPFEGFEDSFPERLYPEILVSEDDEGNVWVDFNKWVDAANAPDVSYPKLKRPNVPFPWTAPLIEAKMQEDESKMLVDDRILQVMMPVPVYTPLLFLMLNGTRVKGTKVYKYAKVISCEEVLKAYTWVQFISQKPHKDNDPMAEVVDSARNQYSETLGSIERNTKAYFAKIPNRVRYLLDLQKRINDDTLKVLEQMDPLTETEEQVLMDSAKGYISEMFMRINALEVLLIRLLCPRFQKPANTRRFHIGSGLPAMNPDVPQSLLESLDADLQSTSLEILKLRAKFGKCMFIVPEKLACDSRLMGIPVHFLRLLCAIDLFSPVDDIPNRR